MFIADFRSLLLFLSLCVSTVFVGNVQPASCQTTKKGIAKDVFPIAEQCQQVAQDSKAVWRTIPWETDLLHAQNLAVEKQKPIFVWAMDGHPLGCT